MKNVLKLFYIILMMISLFLINACDLSSNISVSNNQAERKASEVIDSVYAVSYNEEKTDWKIIADKVDRFPEKHQWTGFKVRFESLESNTSQRTIITCDRAEIDEISNIIVGIGNVEIKSPKGYLRTELLKFNRFTDEIEAPNYVYLKRGDNIIQGSGLKTNVNFDYVNLQKVSGQGNSSEEIFD